jgi:rRNA processing protein Gar1
MQSLAKGSFTATQVKDALKSNRVIKFEYELLDKNDKKIGTIDECSGSYSFNSFAEIKGSARFNMNEKRYKDINFLSEQIRPVFCLFVRGEWLKWQQGIYLLSSPNRTEQNGGVYRDIEAYDKGLILKEDITDNRYFIPKGTLYTDAIRVLILSTGITKISIQESDLTLSVDKEYEIGTSKLTIINDLLNSINYNSVYFNENGFCMVKRYINPKDRVYEFEYETNDKSIVPFGSSETMDAFSIPNKFIRYVQNPEADYMRSVFTNDKASNKLSTVSRGRVITDIQAVTDIADQATLDDYVRRVATEKSQVFGGIQFPSMIMPHHSILDCLYVRNTTLGVSEKFIETSWEIDTDGLMKHTCRKVVELW